MFLNRTLRNVVLASVAGVLFPLAVLQAEPAPATAADREYEAAVVAARKVLQQGPADVKLLNQAMLKLPEGFGFIPSREAAALLRSMGNVVHQEPIGVIVPLGDGGGWFVVARYEGAGYIKDDDAKDWNADELLSSIKSGTEEANKERKARGISEMEILGWVEPPRYSATSHQLVWSISSKDKGDTSTQNRGINYNTYALGREGYISMNLVTDLQSIESQKPVAQTLLAGLRFNDGKRYADFNSSTDKVATYGLAALVGGVAAKKLGLFAVAAAFFVKFAKVFALAGLAALAGLGKWWSGRKNRNTPKA
jgi:uncharacterized membrane-anchored protein